MTWTITDFDEITITIDDNGFKDTFYIPKFRIYLEVDEPYLYLYWTDTEKGDSGLTRVLALDYQDVELGYGGPNPSSATELETVLENYIVSAFTISPNVTSVTDDGNGVVIVDNTDPSNPVIKYDGLSPLLLMGG